MDSRTNLKDSMPVLDVSSSGVVDTRGHFLQHAAVVPQKPRTTEGRQEERAVIIRSNGIDSAEGAEHGARLPPKDEITAVRKGPRSVRGRNALRTMTFIEANRVTILVLVLGVVLLLFALGLGVRA